MLAVRAFDADRFDLGTHRALIRIAAQLAPSCRRLAAEPWITPARASEDQAATTAALVEAQLDAMDRARTGADLAAEELGWPCGPDQHGAERTRALLAARLSVGWEFGGWLWLGSDAQDWFRVEDETMLRLAARLLSGRVATWAARLELSATR